eukprot:531181-Ditylum_brightwellii.AAC.1
MKPSNNTTSNNNDNKRQMCSPMEKWLKRVKLSTKNAFSFLDMKMMWDDQGFLQFGVYHKEGKAIKYGDHTDLEPVDFPTLDKNWEKEVLSRIHMKKKCCDTWRTFFVLGYSDFLKTAKIPDLIRNGDLSEWRAIVVGTNM